MCHTTEARNSNGPGKVHQTEACIGRKLGQSIAKMATLSVERRLGKPIAKILTLVVWRLLAGTVCVYFKHTVNVSAFRPENQHM